MRWEELTSPEIEALDRDRSVVVMPIGSIEQHGRHLPVGTDAMVAHSVSLAAAKLARNGTTVVLPPLWYGFSAHHMQFAGTITLPATMVIEVVERIVDCVIAHGFRRVLILNGHGGNGGPMDVMASTLGHRHYRKARIAALTYFVLAREEIATLRKSKTGGMGHACEFETAVMMHLHGELVKADRMDIIYPDPGSSYLTTDLLGASSVRTYLDFKDLSPTGVLGDPSLATPAHGSEFFASVAAAVARFFDDFAGWPIIGETP